MGHIQAMLMQLSILVCISLLVLQTTSIPISSSNGNGTASLAVDVLDKEPVEGFVVKSVEFEIGLLEDVADNSTDSSAEPQLVTDRWEETEVAFLIPSLGVAPQPEDHAKTSTNKPTSVSEQ